MGASIGIDRVYAYRGCIGMYGETAKIERRITLTLKGDPKT